MDIKGLQYYDDFISDEEEKELLKSIDEQEWNTSLKRRTQHYGYIYDYNSKEAAKKTLNIPIWCNFIIERLIKREVIKNKPDQLIVNEYYPGQGIAMHTDNVKSFSDEIVSLSLGSSIIMDFKHWKTYKTEEIFLKKRSLLSLNGEARYDWGHGIKARLQDNGIVRERRVSLTFRKMKIETKIETKIEMKIETKKIEYIKIVSGDLLNADEEYICQQTNCISVNAHGLSKTIRNKFGIDPYSHRKSLNGRNHAIPEDCDKHGTIKVYQKAFQKEIKVICMFAQYGMGKPFSYGNNVEDSFEKRLHWFKLCLFEIAKLKPRSLAFPYNIGCGLAGGNWDDYFSALTYFSNYFKIPVTIYKL